MRENVFAVLIGALTGILVYSVIGWIFTRKIKGMMKYKLIFFLSLIGTVIVVLIK